MADMVSIKQGDTARAFTDALTIGGVPINLAGATVKFVGNLRVGRDKIGGPATVTDSTAGSVSYTPVPADVDVPGLFNIEWQITFGDGSKLTVPSSGYSTLLVVAQLA